MTIMALSGFTTAYRAERAIPRQRKPRTPILVRLGRVAGRYAPHWPTLRSFALTATGLGLIDTAAFHYALWAGLVATGVSVLILDWKTEK